ncbi:beta strand repeat-containing protein [Luteolibacter soli]|uniref:Autotransporter-associated beta strand repeat-containing protein n=1 Tax=Luteolibacter soli TaxID=3135280 RepID=A0ABU9ATA8_9BACT
MKQKLTSGILTPRISLLALAAFTQVTHAQATRTWDGGGVPATNMDIAANWSADTIPNGTNGDTMQWDGTVAGPLSLTYTAAGTGANLTAGGGLHMSVLGTQTGSLTINEASGTAGLRIRDFTVASGAGAVTLGSLTGADGFTLGSGTVVAHTWTNNSSNPVTFANDIQFSAGGGVTHTLTLTGPGNWNVNTTLIRPAAATGTINVIKDGAGTMNLGTVNSLGNAAFTINAGTLENTSGAALTMTNTTQSWNGDFAFSNGASTSPTGDLSLGTGAFSLGTAAGTSRTVTTNGAAILTAAGVIANGTTANSLIKSGTGALRLDGANTFSGGFTLNAGTLHFANNAALGTGPLTINGGVLQARLASRTLANAVTINGDCNLGVTNNNNQIVLSGTVSLGGGTRTLTVPETTQNPDVNLTGVISNGGLTKAGAGQLNLAAANTYSGPTTVSANTLRVDGTGSINGSSGITINGADAKFLYTSSVALTPPITLTQGTLDASGTIGAVSVGNATTFANGNGTTTPLTTGNLSFAGAATVNVNGTSSNVGIAAGTLTTSGTDSAIMLNVTRTGSWSNGMNNLISFTSFPSADINDFDYTIINAPPLGARQTFGDLAINGNNIALEVIGTSIYWTGLQSNQWTALTVPGSKNWKQTSDNVATDFQPNDDVVFGDTPATNQTIQIDDGDVFPTTATFNNSAINYTLASSSTFAIGNGVLTKSGTGSLTINTNNYHSGGTILNAGTLNANTATALGTGPVVINGGTLNNSSAGAIVSTNNNTQTWNSNFTFTGTNSFDMGSGAVTSTGAGDRTVTVSANTLAVGELKTAAGQGFVKQGTGTLALTSTGAGAASSVINGTLNVAAGTLQINRTGALDGNAAGDLTATTITGTGTITNGANFERWLIITPTTPGTFGGSIQNGPGTAGLGFRKGGTVNFTLTGNNSYTGVTTVDGGTLTITGTNATGGAVNVAGTALSPAILNLQNSNALGTGALTSANRNSGIQLQGGIVLPSTVTLLTSNDGTSGATVPYAVDSVSGDNVINGNITLRDGGGSSIFQSETGATLKLAGNVTIITGQGSRGMIFQGASTGANEFSGVLSDLSVTSVASIIKNGTGTWKVSGVNTYTGPTTVNAGTLLVTGDSPATTGLITVAAGATLGGNGDFGGPMTVAAGGHHALAVAATPAAQVTRSVASLDLTAVGDILDLTAAATPADGAYTLIHTTSGITGQTGGVLDDTVVNLTGLTGTVSVIGNDLVLTVGSGGSAFSTWIAGYPSIPLADRDPGDDPDGDGFTNQVEFALGGAPNSGSNNAKIYSIVADSDFDGDSTPELLLTMAVRTGTGTFTGATSKSAPSDDPTYGYTVQGSLNLNTFNEVVNVVPTAVPPVGVTLPAGYTWKTFSLNGSNGAASKGFMRVLVTP